MTRLERKERDKAGGGLKVGTKRRLELSYKRGGDEGHDRGIVNREANQQVVGMETK